MWETSASHEIFVKYRITNLRILFYWQRSHDPRSPAPQEKWVFEKFLVSEEELRKLEGVTKGVHHPTEVVRTDRFCARYEFANGVDMTTLCGHIGMAWLLNTPDHAKEMPSGMREQMRMRIQSQGWLYADGVYVAPEFWSPRGMLRDEQ